MMRRTFDAATINSLAKDKSIKSHIGGECVGDITPFVNDVRNIAFVSDFGAVFMHWQSPRVFASHMMFLPEGRGAHALRCCRWVIRQMFEKFDCESLLASTPSTNKPAVWLVRHLGFKWQRREAGREIMIFTSAMWRERSDHVAG